MEKPDNQPEKSPGIELKRATENDLEQFIELEKQIGNTRTYSAMISHDEALDYLRRSKTYFITYGDKVVGNVAYEMTGPGKAHVSGIMVIPECQGRGIGRAAMEKILDEIKGTSTIDLVTHPDNTRAINLYESLGFTKGEVKENYYGDGEPRVVMTLTR